MGLRAFAGGVVFAAGAGFTVGQAAAADLPPAPVAPVASAPAAIFTWTGFYIGGHLGGGFDRATWSDPFTGANNLFTGTGLIGGAQAGGNLQFNRLVLGVEGDFSYAGSKAGGLDSLGNAISTDTNWTSTIAGRIGAAFDRLLVYGKGGVAFAHDRSTFTDLAGIGAASTAMRAGWIAGVGLEYGISQNWSAKIEYDYLGFGSDPLNFATPAAPSYATNAALGVQEIKAGINFRFGGR